MRLVVNLNKLKLTVNWKDFIAKKAFYLLQIIGWT